MKNLCSIIILNFNGKRYLHDCLASVLAQSYADVEVILVDNGSSDGSVEYVRQHFPSVHIISSEKNLGFAGGNNLGVRYAHGEIIVLLNNDTIVDENWLQTLSDALTQETVAIASSHVCTNGIPEYYYEYNGSVNLLAHNIMRVFQRSENTFYPNGASLAFKRKLLGEPFDDDYFAYCEDLYLGLRARFMGYDVIHVSASQVQHIGGATSKKMMSEWISYLQERNRLLTILLFFSLSTRMRLIPLIVLNCVIKIFVSFFSTRYKTRALMKAYWWLITHQSTIRRKRIKLYQERTRSDADVLSWMTSRVLNGENSIEKIINSLSYLYCTIVRLHTIEFYREKRR